MVEGCCWTVDQEGHRGFDEFVLETGRVSSFEIQISNHDLS